MLIESQRFRGIWVSTPAKTHKNRETNQLQKGPQLKEIRQVEENISETIINILKEMRQDIVSMKQE